VAELAQVRDILDAGKVDEEQLQAALQALFFHQCLYEDWPSPPAYRTVVRHIGQIQPIVGAFGYKVTYHPVAHMLVLESTGVVYALHMSRLRKDETSVLLALRLLYAEQVSSLDENGRVEITTDDVHDRLRAAGDEPPPMQRLLDILRLFQRKGVVRVGELDPEEQVVTLAIMPGVTVLVPDVYVEALVQWLENRTDEAPKGLLAIVADARGQEEPASSVAAAAEDEEENGIAGNPDDDATGDPFMAARRDA
jgi:hypothetical protein